MFSKAFSVFKCYLDVNVEYVNVNENEQDVRQLLVQTENEVKVLKDGILLNMQLKNDIHLEQNDIKSQMTVLCIRLNTDATLLPEDYQGSTEKQCLMILCNCSGSRF